MKKWNSKYVQPGLTAEVAWRAIQVAWSFPLPVILLAPFTLRAALRNIAGAVGQHITLRIAEDNNHSQTEARMRLHYAWPNNLSIGDNTDATKAKLCDFE